MEDENPETVHWSFWLIGVLTLIWNFMGSVNFFMQRDPEILAKYGELERTIVEGRPAWATAAFALAVFGGTLGNVLLLMRRRAAQHLFIASLMGVLVTQVHSLAEVGAQLGPGLMVGIVAMPVVVAAFLIWYARYAEGRGWTR